MLNFRCSISRFAVRFVASLTVILVFPTASWARDADTPLAPAKLATLLPGAEEESALWWREGFPAVVDGTPWHRVLAGPRHAFVLDTESLTVPHFGLRSSGAELASLPSAELELTLTVDGVRYRATDGGPWSRHSGPRLIESGRFFQRADITDLTFAAEESGERLPVEARFITTAWSDRLALGLEVRPGRLPIAAGESSFGHIGGGFGLDGENHFELSAEELPDRAEFTLAFQVFVPSDFRAGEHQPWLVCKNANEHADGNFGIQINRDAIPLLRFNVGGGRENSHLVSPDSRPGTALKQDAWNHLALRCDSESFSLFLNGVVISEAELPAPRRPVPGGISFGRRHDNSGDGYRFRGVIDEIRWFDRALAPEELKRPSAETPLASWTFREDGTASATRPRATWGKAELGIAFASGNHRREQRTTIDFAEGDTEEGRVLLVLDPETLAEIDPRQEKGDFLSCISAQDPSSGRALPVDFDAETGWTRVDLDGIEPVPPPGGSLPSNDALERVRLRLRNPSDRSRPVRLVFAKSARGFRQRIGSPITGVSVVLRDRAGNPTGIPVQLSKNWHRAAEPLAHDGTWLHAITRLNLPPASDTELELVVAYGHWGGLPAASHAQLSLVGWGSNQLWHQSALGSWGESICYEPGQVQRGNVITDVRPLLVTRKGGGAEPWGWTNNVGGGDFFRLHDKKGTRLPSRAVRSRIARSGPCLTEATYEGRIGKDAAIDHRVTVSLARGADLVRGTYRIRLDVRKAIEFSRLAVFQIGADNYNSCRDRKIAVGNAGGLLREWNAQWGGDTYRTEPIALEGKQPWVSLHETEFFSPADESGALANRGFVIRAWQARLGGQPAAPHVAERGIGKAPRDSSLIDLVPPPGIDRLLPGDFVEATLEHLVLPRFAEDYYGPDAALRAALAEAGNTWRMVHREASGNARELKLQRGSLQHRHPDIRIATEAGNAGFTLTGGLGHVPVTFTGLPSHDGFRLLIDGQPLDQGVHGNDFWQTDYDASTGTWSRTYNLAAGRSDEPVAVRLVPLP